MLRHLGILLHEIGLQHVYTCGRTMTLSIITRGDMLDNLLQMTMSAQVA